MPDLVKFILVILAIYDGFIYPFPKSSCQTNQKREDV
jgi:hypothetical protein